jgi:TRAP-type C4-dicarboxylate transport system permease small subunit
MTGTRRRRPAALRWLSTAEAAVGGLLLVMLFVLILTQAIQRYLPVGGWVWTGELARFSLVWLTFAMAGYLMARDGHVALKLVDFVAKGVVLRIVCAFAHIMVVIICLNLAYEAYDLVTRPVRQVSPAMGIPLNYLYVIPLAGLLLTALRSIVGIFLPEPETDGEPALTLHPSPEEPSR